MYNIKVERNTDISLSKQIYTQIRDNILIGSLSKNDKLPSTRYLSEYLHVSRNVVIEAYDQLICEGYIETKNGSGSYVSGGAFLDGYTHNEIDKDISKQELLYEPQSDVIDFRCGVPDLSLFPIKKWSNTYKQVCDSIDPSRLDYHRASGCYDLKLQLSKYLFRSRGVKSCADDIYVTTGAAQAFNLLCKMMLKDDSEVIIEDPINKDISQIITSSCKKIYSIPVDDQGLITSKLPKNTSPKFIFATPSHQYPTGGILSVQRRIELINYAKKHNCYIIEDDYDSEYRFDGLPISSMQSLDAQRVIYVGTFSKKLFPALRIGYVVVPKSFHERFEKTKHLEDIHSPILEQLTLARFLEQGYVDRHISNSKKIYHKRRMLLINELEKNFGDQVEIIGSMTGIHLAAKFSYYKFTKETFENFLQHGVKIHPIDDHTNLKGSYSDTLMLGYGNLSEQEIIRGVKLIKETMMGN